MGLDRMPDQPITILVVEDDPGLRALLLELLQDEGYAVLVATDGCEGIELAQQHGPEAILLDMSLPVTSGRAVMWQLRGCERTRQIPVIALSGRPELLADAGAQSSDVLLAKPFDIVVLLDQLARLVNAGHDAG
jgi:two-component system response regulator (stage 0 sporulation protein F)